MRGVAWRSQPQIRVGHDHRALPGGGDGAVVLSLPRSIPALVAEYQLTGFAQAALTSGVQAGFVLGCLVSAYFGLPDRVDPRRLLRRVDADRRGGERIAARRQSRDRPSRPLLRVVTGIAMAGVYPVGMKLAVDVGQRATWA